MNQPTVKTTAPLTDEAPDTAQAALPPVLIWATVFLLISAIWVRKTSLIAFTILVAEGAPPIPALTALVAMTAIGYGFHRLTRTSKYRKQALLIYITMSLALVTLEANGVRQLLASLTVARYFAAPGNEYGAFADLLPEWMTPSDSQVITNFYEGSPSGAFPWHAWAVPLAMWSGLFMLIGLSLLCMVSLFRRPWSEHERLTFPLAELPLHLAPDPAAKDQTSLLRQPLFWIGVGIAAIYNGSNIAHAFSPQTPAIGQTYELNKLLTERPWTALRPMTMTFRPEIIGLGYLVPVDVLLSIWSFFLLFRFENFFATLGGYQIGNFPFERAQGMGSYVGLIFFLLYVGRKHLKQVALSALGGARPEWDKEELIPSRWAFWGLMVGMGGFVAFCVSAGMSLGLALAYVILSFGVALVYIRVRAQTGLPINYVVPREEVAETILALKPTTGHFSNAALRSEAVYATISAMSRMTFPQLGAFEIEAVRMGYRADLGRKQVLTTIIYGLAIGLAIGLFMHMQAYYSFGANVLDGGSTEGGYRTRQALANYDRLKTRAFTAVPMDMQTNVARLVGLALTVAMLLLRVKYLRFPLNPLGLALSGSYGHSIWFPAFVAWLSKTLILRLGGPQTYRTAMPVFMGLAIGHVLFAGGIWGIVGAFSEEVAKRYLMWFA
ncbi:MAG: DUF6785 family protein [Armatimonadia bacterium]